MIPSLAAQPLMHRIAPFGVVLFGGSPRRAALILASGAIAVLFISWAVVSTSIILRRGSTEKCPHCGSSRIRHSWLLTRDRILLWCKPFRCEACLKRFYLFKWFIPARQRAAKAAAR